MSNRFGDKKLRKSYNRLLPQDPSQSNPFLHLKRTPAELVSDQGEGQAKIIIPVMIVLNELNPRGVSLFSQSAFVGEEILSFNIPSLKSFFIKGRVVACKELAINPSILSERAYPYRVELEFIFENESEVKAVLDYCAFLKTTFLSSAA